MRPKVEPHLVELKDWELKAGVVYGPFRTRRQGNSLGINLLAPMRKHCTFNCVYCQCGWTREAVPALPEDFTDYPSPARVRDEIVRRFGELLEEGNVPDAIIVSGNGEPTLYPWLEEVVDIILPMRNMYFPSARTGILTAGTELGREEVRRAVDRLDERMVKLDAGSDKMHRKVNLPLVSFDLDRLEQWVSRLRDCIVQSCFVRGTIRRKKMSATGSLVSRGSVRSACTCIASTGRLPHQDCSGSIALRSNGLPRGSAPKRASKPRCTSRRLGIPPNPWHDVAKPARTALL
jgi:pyruvate-formate lyase-activating enzyme